MQLVIPSYLVAFLLSIVLGLTSGSHRGKWLDKLIDGLCSVGIATPPFWLAMILIFFMGYQFNLLPILGMHTIGMENSFPDYLAHYIMPFIVMVNCVPAGFDPVCEVLHDWAIVGRLCGRAESVRCFRFEILSKHVAKYLCRLSPNSE